MRSRRVKESPLQNCTVNSNYKFGVVVVPLAPVTSAPRPVQEKQTYFVDFTEVFCPSILQGCH